MLAVVQVEVVAPSVTDALSVRLPCMKDGKSCREMALKSPRGLPAAKGAA